jgi:hypothetical protein
MLDGRPVDNGDTGFRPFKCQGAEPGTFSAAHNAHLHMHKLGLHCFKYSAGNAVFISIAEVAFGKNMYERFLFIPNHEIYV